MKMLDRSARVFLFLLGMIFFSGQAFSQTDFYKGKTIKIIRGGGPGGSGEFQTRALVKFLEKYIPGKPHIMVEFIEGAAGRKAANVIYSTSKPDGLTIGSIGAGLVVGPILGLPGSSYDLDKFIYLGSTDGGDPEFGSFAKTDTERKLLDMFRAFQYPRWPYIFSPGTPTHRVQIIREAMRKSFADPDFPGEFKKLMGDGPAPLSGEELERAIKELPREKEVVQLYQKLAGADPLPAR